MGTDLRLALRENMRRLRKLKGFSQITLAELVKVSASHIAEIETMNRFPSPEVLNKIAQSLGVSAPQLLMDSQESALYESYFQRQEIQRDIMREMVKEMKNLLESDKDTY